MKTKIIKITLLVLLIGCASCGNNGTTTDTRVDSQNEREDIERSEDDEVFSTDNEVFSEEETPNVDSYHKALEDGYAKIVYKANDNYYVGICDNNRYTIFSSLSLLDEGTVYAGDFTSSIGQVFDENNNEISIYVKETAYDFDDCIKYLANENHLDSRGINRYKQILVDDGQYGEIVYEGRNGYCIVSSPQGYAIIEFYSNYGSEGDMIYGNINHYSFTYAYVGNNTSTSKVYIEDYAISKDRAVEWMGGHNHLKFNDQQSWDNRNSSW